MITLLLFLTTLQSAAPVADKADAIEEAVVPTHNVWEMVKESKGVTTYVRWLYDQDGSKTRERKGEMLVDCSLDETIRLLTDASATRKWMSGVIENYRLSTSTPNQWCTYTLYNIPWPFEKRDLVSVYEIASQAQGKRIVITIKSKAGVVPEKKDIERLDNYKATWIVTEVKPHLVNIVFCAMSDTPPVFPRYIQDPVIEKIFHNDLVRLKELLSPNEPVK